MPDADAKVTATQLESLLEYNDTVEALDQAIDGLLQEFRESGASRGRIVIEVTNDLPEEEEEEEEDDEEFEDDSATEDKETKA